MKIPCYHLKNKRHFRKLGLPRDKNSLTDHKMDKRKSNLKPIQVIMVLD